MRILDNDIEIELIREGLRRTIKKVEVEVGDEEYFGELQRVEASSRLLGVGMFKTNIQEDCDNYDEIDEDDQLEKQY